MAAMRGNERTRDMRWQLLAALMIVVMFAGCTRKQAPEVDERASEPVVIDLWAGVPPLAPEPGDIAEVLVPKPGPQKPEQVGETIELPFPPPAPETPPVGASEQPEGPLEVLRSGPEGDQTLVEAIRVSFNHPMVPLASIEQLRSLDAPMQIEPAVAGEFRWMGTRTLAFYPSGRLPFSTRYAVTIPAGTESTHGTTLGKPVAWTITTPTLAVERSVPAYSGLSTHVGLDQPIVLRFNQPVNAEAIAAGLTLAAKSKKVALELVPEGRWADEGLASLISAWVTGGEQAWERSRVVVLRPRTALTPNTTYTVALAPGVYGEGPLRSAAIRFNFKTYPPLILSPRRCDPAPCSASQGLHIEATNQIRDARVIDKVRVTPVVEGLQINQGWGGITLTGEFVGDTTYEVTVDAGLEDVYGQRLAQPYVAKVRLGPLDRSLSVWPKAQSPGIIEANAGHTIQLRVTGLRELEVMGASFNSARLGQFYGGSWSGDEWPASLPKPTVTRVIDVSDSRERTKLVTINVDDFIEGTDSFVYLKIRSEEFEQWGRSMRRTIQQIVSVTNLGITAAFDRTDAVVLVTDLASGEPVANAEVRLLTDSGERELWKGKADAAGRARPKLNKSFQSLRTPVIVARKGDDEVFMPIAHADLEGRWITGLLGKAAEDEVRAFMFTERQPYKPGETVHLVGVLRRETTGPTGGVQLWGAGLSAAYTVTTPRGVKVQEGSLTVGAFGTFAVDIETDANGDTGDYRFELVHRSLFGKNHHFNHRFAVEAFRTPEFEVEVARADSTPLYFGDELELEVRGRYLFGAPMVGAAVQYTLQRQTTDFRPPVTGLSGFHFAARPGRRWVGFGGWGGLASLSEQLDAGSLVLDNHGVLQLRHALAQVEPAKPTLGPAPKPDPKQDEPPLPQAATFSVEATVVDDNRQAIAAKGSFVVHPAAYYVGLRSERSVLKAGERTRVEAVVVDVDGKRVAGVDLKLRAVRNETTRTPVNENGVWTFAYATEEIQTSACDLRSDAGLVACEVSVDKAGTYSVIAELSDSAGRRNRAAIEIYVHGEDAVVWDKDQKRVDLVPDKHSYEPGEVAKILVRSPFDRARGFLVIEREGMAQTHDLAVEGGVAMVEVPITADMVAGVTASAVLSKPRTLVAGAPVDQDLGAPAAASGQVALEVSKDQKTVVVEVEPRADTIEPGAKLRVDLRTLAVDGEPIPAAVAVFVVDEGVLSLMGYATPDPLGFFHRKREGEVGLFANHPLVLPRNAGEQPGPEQPLQPQQFGDEIGEAYGVGGLGLVGTGRGGGGTGEGTIGLGNTGLIGKGGGGGSGGGYGAGPRSEKKAQPRARPAPGAAPAAEAAPGAAGGLDASLAMNQDVSLRTLFATTAYFRAELVTDVLGRASVEIDMPENLTSYRIMAVAVDSKVDDRFGSGEASVRVRKTIMLRPSLPRFLNMGDAFEASVMVDNQSEAPQVVMVGARGLNVKISGTAETTVEIPAGESREVRFPMTTDRVGIMRLQFAALSNRGRDATELELPVLVPATKQAFADYGMTSSSVSRAVMVPTDALPGYGGLEVSMSSTALNGLEDAVEFLVSYPYECSEQTASRLLPIFALGKILDEFPIADVHDRQRREALANAGVARLLRRQNSDGGFGFWSSDRWEESWPYVSTWVTFALLEGKQAGFEVAPDQLGRALNYLENYVRRGVMTRWGVYYDWTSRSFALWLLSREGRGAALFDEVWAERAKLPLYARVLLMSAAHRYGRKEPVEAVLAELRDLVIEDARVIRFAESRTEAAAEGLAVLMHSNTQTDAIVLMTLLELGDEGGELGDDGMAPKIIAGLMSDRDPRLGGRWRTTHANAWALLAAARYYAVMEAETPDFKARIWLDERYAGEQGFVGRDMSKVNQQIPMAALLDSPAGQQISAVTLTKDGPGKLYYRLGLRYAPADFRMEAVDRGYTVSRRYEALAQAGEDQGDPTAVTQGDDGTWVVKAGTNVKVTITLVAQHRATYVVVDDALPAGFEGQNPRFLTSVAAASESAVDYGYGRARGSLGYGASHRWWNPWFSFSHTQMRDDRMLLFADWLPAGVYTYSYTARATNVGTFVLPPVHAEAMYEPERFGHGSSSVVKIVDDK